MQEGGRERCVLRDQAREEGIPFLFITTADGRTADSFPSHLFSFSLSSSHTVLFLPPKTSAVAAARSKVKSHTGFF